MASSKRDSVVLSINHSILATPLTKCCGPLTVVLLVLLQVTGFSTSSLWAQSPTVSLTAQGEKKSTEETKSAEDSQGSGPAFKFLLKVIGIDGKPVVGAHVQVRSTPRPSPDQIRVGEYVRLGTYGVYANADSDGRLEVVLPVEPDRFNISIKHPGFGPYWAGWSGAHRGQSIPNEFTAELAPGWSVGGVIVDSNGGPVAGADVHPRVKYKKRPGDFEILGIGTRLRTDTSGKWRYDHVPDDERDVLVEIDHPDYRPLRPRLSREVFGIALDAEPTGRLEMTQGLTVTGTVTDETGSPIAGARVRTKFVNDLREARTDEEGKYRLVGCESGMARIVVSADGKATDMQELMIESRMAAVDFKMQPGGKIRIRIVDDQGKGIARSRIFFQHWRGPFSYFEFDHVDQYTDENGVWEWNEAPLDWFRADICPHNGMQLPSELLVARDEEYVFQPPKVLAVSGKVIDAITMEPIKNFRVVSGQRNDNPRDGITWQRHRSYEATGGSYIVTFGSTAPAHLIRIEADGYRVATSRDLMNDEGKIKLDFELQPTADIAATVLTPDGLPAKEAKIAFGGSGTQITILNGDIVDRSTFATKLTVQAAGRFSIPGRDDRFDIVITHPTGFAHLSSADGPIPNQIILTPWARGEGSFRIGSKAASNVPLTINNRSGSLSGDGARVIFGHEVTTGEDGRFVFQRVVPGMAEIGREFHISGRDGMTEITSRLSFTINFVAGKTTKIDLGGTGRPVIGKFAPPVGHAGDVDWNFALIQMRVELQPPVRPEPPEGVRDRPEVYKAWWTAWLTTNEGRNWLAEDAAFTERRHQFPSINASVGRDGTFRIDDVPPGRYLMDVHFTKRGAGALFQFPVDISPVDSGPNRPVDLGTVTLE